ncbi:hypothetical protein IWQ47_002052 [Aquimarina sp. EL_43]|uniref:hypothetical protein n=1 Tax=Aquimarina TaxID=290174 RepID=UPI00046EEDF2|nr:MULTISPECIES: hypothetical protein [Aquimarina]MBG6130576.1 hypothetical protein [Aquimarina sp. EL_35]MBG6151278.1 hypothetical protein [Aquimarina sp. EL_32]MBG6168978.1 hypothetical protein [Aquimarina sp. EL_43]
MDISIFLAKFWGWYLIMFFFILSFNPNRIKQIFEDLKDQKFVIIISFIAIIVGLLNILFHNIWEPSWKFIITAIGWASLGMGLLLFVFPKGTAKWLEFINIKLVQVLYVLLFLIGVLLLNAGYELVPY